MLFAQTVRDWSQCIGREGSIIDIVIKGCTAVIQAGQDTPVKLALAFNNRGVARRLKGEYDVALQDYNEAIRLNPISASQYNNRGVIYRIKGDYDRAIADYDTAIKLNTNYTAAFFARGRKSSGACRDCRVYVARSQHDRASRLCCLAPALRASRVDLQYALKDGARGSASPGSRRLSNVFVVSQFAVSLVLLVGAGLTLKCTGPGNDNIAITWPATGTYTFTLDATSTASPVLTVTGP
jgi:tetratricopeptide (TPR) repeat protein